MGNLKKVVKKAKKVAKKAVKEKTMGDEIYELNEQIVLLKNENEELKAELESLHVKNEELEADLKQLTDESEAATSLSPKKWVRGKLPGEKLIKTNPETGEFVQIDKAEWDALV